jgi:hypothetical protein
VTSGAVREVYYWLGRWDADAMRFTADHEAPRIIDVGRDHFTGPSGFVDPKTGRAIVFTIAQGETTPHFEHAAGWAHSGGLPMHVWLGEDDTLRVGPIEELDGLRGTPQVDLADTTLAEANAALAADGVGGDLLEIELVADVAGRTEGAIGLSVRRAPDGAEHADLTYDLAAGRLALDRRQSSVNPDVRGKRIDGGPAPLGEGDEGGTFSLRVFLDRSMFEAYLNERTSLTSRLFPDLDASTGLLLLGPDDLRIRRLRVWPMSAAPGPTVPVKPRGIGIDPRTAWTSGLPNHDFAGCDLSGWEVLRGDAFSDRVVTEKAVFWGGIFFNPSRSIPGGCHLWGFNAWSGDAATGAMRSATFELGGDGRINFLLAGGHDPERLYIALVRARDDAVLMKSTGIDYEEYSRVHWDASAYVGEQLYLLVVDDATGGWGHINLDDIHVPVAGVNVPAAGEEEAAR